MDNLKKIILICSILFVIIIIVLIISIANSKRNVQEDYWTENDTVQEYNLDINIKENTSKYDFFAVKNSIEYYYSYIKGMNISLQDIKDSIKFNDDESYNYQEELEESQKRKKIATYSCLGKEYLDEWNININNIEEKIKLPKNIYTSIEKLYKVDSSENVSIYFVYGNNINKDTSELTPFSMMVVMDMVKCTFKIYPTEYIEKYYNNIENGVKIDLKIDQIEDETYNTFEYNIISEAESIKYYINEYNMCLLYNKQRAYDLLDEEYKEKRFGSLKKFTEYIKNNNQIMLTKYYTQNKNDYTQYICLDDDNKYYMVNETTPTKFALILDTYTLDLPEFLDKYNSANEQGKCALNIQKFMDAINSYDYNYAYNCLSEGFKTNYFATVQDFKEYIESTLYTKNEVSYESFEEQTGLYKYKVKITNKENDQESITKTFIVKLNDGTDFEMSFNVD